MLLSPLGSQLAIRGNASNSVCWVRRTGTPSAQVRHDTGRSSTWPAAGSSQSLTEVIGLPEQGGTWRAVLSNCIPNCLGCSQPPGLLAKWLREESQWHNEKNKHSTTPRNCSMNHQLRTPPKTACANSTEWTVLDQDLPPHWEQPLSLSRLFCWICFSYQEPVDFICIALYADLRSHSKCVLLNTWIKLFLQSKLDFLRKSEIFCWEIHSALQTCLLLGVILKKEPSSGLLNTQKNAYDYFGSGDNHFLPSFIEWA